MRTPKTMPCPKNGRPLHVVTPEAGILSAFCHFCSAWHNWTHQDIERLRAKKARKG